METVRLDDWQRWQRAGCTRLPVVAVVREVALPSSWAAFTAAPATVLLESAQAGRYTYICSRPARVIVGGADAGKIWAGDCSRRLETRPGAPLAVLSSILAERPTPPPLAGWPAMTGGLIALLGYDLVRTWEQLPLTARRDLDLPLYAAIEPAELLVYDHAEQTLAVFAWTDVAADMSSASLAGKFHEATGRALDQAALFTAAIPASPVSRPPSPHTPFSAPLPPSFTPEAFRSAVDRIHEYIAAGHTYQVNLSLRTSRATAASPVAIYEALRRINPSPYMGLFRLPEFALVCGSPELLVRLTGDRIVSRPIAGTRPRGDGPPQDSHLSAELLANEKERAEHLMLVDLIRNDIGRAAAYGSVHVNEFMSVERYSHVQHIVSQVEGRLAAGRTWADVLRAMFPGGTITGCPKIRTMEIIEELEPVGRGFYTGALGWISYSGALEMNIVIRSMLVQHGLAHVQAGAGVVADSRPDRELDESLRKAQALWVALAAAEAATPHV